MATTSCSSISLGLVINQKAVSSTNLFMSSPFPRHLLATKTVLSQVVVYTQTHLRLRWPSPLFQTKEYFSILLLFKEIKEEKYFSSYIFLLDNKEYFFLYNILKECKRRIFMYFIKRPPWKNEEEEYFLLILFLYNNEEYFSFIIFLKNQDEEYLCILKRDPPPERTKKKNIFFLFLF